MDVNIALIIILTPSILLVMVVVVLAMLEPRSWRRVAWVWEKARRIHEKTLILLYEYAEVSEVFSRVPGPDFARMSGELFTQQGCLERRRDELAADYSQLGAIYLTRPKGVAGRTLFYLRIALTQTRLRARLERTCVKLEQELLDAQAVLQHCEESPLVAAKNIRAARGKIAGLKQLLNELENAGLQGLDEARVAIKEIEMHETSFPRGFSGDGPREQILMETRQVFEILREIKPKQMTWLIQLGDWRQTYRDIKEINSVIQKRLGYLGAAMTANNPLLFSVTSFQFLLDGIQTRVKERIAALKNANVQDLNRFVKDLRTLEQDMLLWSDGFDQARANAELLEQTLGVLNGILKELKSRRQNSQYPDYWLELDLLLGRLAVLGPRLKPLQDENRKYEAGELTEALETALALLEELKRIQQDTAQSLARFNQLTELLESENLQGWEKWHGEAQTILQAAQKYGSKNWDRTVQPSRLKEDLDRLEELQRKWVASPKIKIIQESQLEDSLSLVEELAELHVRGRQQVQLLKERMEEIRLQEQAVITGLKPLIASLAELDLNPFFDQKDQQELAKLREEAETLQKDFERPQDSSVKEKTARLKLLGDKALKDTILLLKKLEGKVRAETSRLHNQLREMDQLARFQDPQVEAAMKLLRDLGTNPSYPLSPTLAEMTKTLQRCVGNLSELTIRWDGLIKSPAMTALARAKDAQQAREEAERAIEAGEKRLAQLHGGNLPEEWRKVKEGLRLLAKDMERFRGKPWDGKVLAKELERIAADFIRLKNENERLVNQAETLQDGSGEAQI